jgi:hypothetical protein
VLLEVLELCVIAVGADCVIDDAQGVVNAVLAYQKVDETKNGFGARRVNIGGEAEGLFGFVQKFVVNQETRLGGN